MNNITIMINYAGMQLQVAKNEQGQDITPLKPIVDLFGLEWQRQLKKVTESEFLIEHLGTCTVLMPHIGGQKREQTCILLSSVTYYLMSISPDRVKANGNESGAKFLSEKIKEWTAALHDYEELGMAINMSHAKVEAVRLKSFLSLCKEKRMTEDQSERKVLSSIMREMAEKIGHPYQNELE